MNSSSQVVRSLPEFVQRQAETALQQFLSVKHGGVTLGGRIRCNTILLFELTPHPLTRETVQLPLALLNWRDNAWQLYFRGAKGRWLAYPGEAGVLRPDLLLMRVAQDELGIFWRQ